VPAPAALALLALLFAEAAPSAAAGTTAGAAAGAPAAAADGGRRYPAGRAGELKALLLERPSAPGAPGWALEYAELADVGRMEPVTRAAERLWAARLGDAARPSSAERKRLRALLASVEGCPLDSVAVRRAATGLARIGIVVPLTGRHSRFGRTFVNGFRLAVDEHNRTWAPTISLVLHDSEGDPLIGARKARWLLRDHGVSVLVGELFSVNTAPLAAATQVVGAVLLSPSATNERLATLGDGVFQLHLGDANLAAALARLVAAGQKKPSLAILASSAPEDSVRAAFLAAACRTAGVQVAGTERVPEGTADLTTPLTVLRGRRAGALALVGPPRLVGNAAAQLPAVWPGVPVFGFESLEPEGLNPEARESLEGARYVTPDHALLGAARDSFEVRYRRAHGEAPTRMSVRGYLSGLALMRGIEGGAVTAAMLREALRAQVYDSDEGRTLRALRPLSPAEPEMLRIEKGVALPLGPGEVP
jgi:ABC-type branched-subunit amino acid transport system substrate-binding protein